MVLLQPPQDFDGSLWLSVEERQSTPVLGFNFYWHARHDQPVSAPGKVACRLRRPPRRAGEGLPMTGLVRQHSTLAAVATLYTNGEGTEAGGAQTSSTSSPQRAVRSADGAPKLLFRELFAGTAGMSKEWIKQGGEALTPVELCSDPHNRMGKQPQHDLSDPLVRGLHLQRAASGPENVFWIASPCTTFCDWQLQNGGTRTFAQPQGGGRGPILEKEVEGNTFADFAAEVFVNALDNGAFPLAESSGPSGRYPKMWDLPSWQAIRLFRAGRSDDLTAFYRHYTRVVFPAHGPLAQVLHRACPGLSPAHRHVPLKAVDRASTSPGAQRQALIPNRVHSADRYHSADVIDGSFCWGGVWVATTKSRWRGVSLRHRGGGPGA